MRVEIPFGLESLEVEVEADRLVAAHRQPAAPPLADPVAAVREALERPQGFPPLRSALTPDDHVAIVLDARLPRLAELLVPILQHVVGAGVAPAAITLLSPPEPSAQGWREALPPEYHGVAVERHVPGDRKRLSYLATTRKGRRLYLNRTVVDADQIIVLARRGYDPLLGYSGVEAALYPALSDEATRQELAAGLTMDAPGEEPWTVRREAGEVAWLLGTPFMVQVIEGAGDEVAHVVGGVASSGPEGQRLLDARWRVTVDRRADTVLAAVSGDPARHDFADLAQALAAAARVVKPKGRIVLLSRATPTLGPGAEQLRGSNDPESALTILGREKPLDMAAAFLWVRAAQQASVYLLSGLPAETAEELFTTPLDRPEQAQRLLTRDGRCLILPDAHKTLAVSEG